MILLSESINELLKQCFQKNITIIVRDKKIASGRFVLFKNEGCYLQFSLSDGSSLTTTEIPYPFNVTKTPCGNLVFDYRLETLAENDFNLLLALRSVTKKRESRYYNTQIEIVVT